VTFSVGEVNESFSIVEDATHFEFFDFLEIDFHRFGVSVFDTSDGDEGASAGFLGVPSFRCIINGSGIISDKGPATSVFDSFRDASNKEDRDGLIAISKTEVHFDGNFVILLDGGEIEVFEEFIQLCTKGGKSGVSTVLD
jgi:hypothetical protein